MISLRATCPISSTARNLSSRTARTTSTFPFFDFIISLLCWWKRYDTTSFLAVQYLAIRRHVIVVDEKFRDLQERLRDRMRGIQLSVRLDDVEKDDELRVVRREIAEERVEIAVGVI